MIKLTNIQSVVLCYYPNYVRMCVRTKKIKSSTWIPLIRVRSEDKKWFGPLLTTRKRIKLIKSKFNMRSSVCPTNTFEVNNYNDGTNTNKNNDDHENDCAIPTNQTELHWTSTKSTFVDIHHVTKIGDGKITRFKKKNPNSSSTCSDNTKSAHNDNLIPDNNKPNANLIRVTVKKTDSKVPLSHIDNLNVENNEITQTSLDENNNKSTQTSQSSLEFNNKMNVPMELVWNDQLRAFPLINTTKSENNQLENTLQSRIFCESKNFKMPGVTRVLNESMSKEGQILLKKWKNKMIGQLGTEGFERYMAELLESSKTMHMLIKSKLNNESVEIPDDLKGTFCGVNLILKNVSNVRMLESHVVHTDLHYRGIIDCVADYRGNLCVIDWKKSDKIKTLNTTYDLPLQLSAYVGALNSDPNYPFKVKMGILAVAYSGGQPPSVFEFTADKLEFYWKEWLKRLEKYYSVKFNETL